MMPEVMTIMIRQQENQCPVSMFCVHIIFKMGLYQFVKSTKDQH